MNIRRSTMIRDMLEQLMPFDEHIMEEDYPSEEGTSLGSFLLQWHEDPAFLEAFERLWDRLLSPKMAEDVKESGRPIRVFTEEEEQFLTTEARGYILKLQAAGLLGADQMEKVIDRAFECWAEEITLDQVRFLVAAVLLYEVFSADDFDLNLLPPPHRGLD